MAADFFALQKPRRGLAKNFPTRRAFIFFAACAVFVVCAFLEAFSADACERVDVTKLRGPWIDELTMLIITNPDAQIMATEAGEVDILGDIARPLDIASLGENKNLNMSVARGMHAFFLLLNNKQSPWDDPALRRAAALAVDRGGIVRMIFSGYCEPINSWLPPASPWSPPNGAQDIYDPKLARQTLSEKGYTWDMSGTIVSPDGKRLPAMKLLTPLAKVAPTTAELAEIIADSLRAFGFPVEAEPMDFSTMISRLDQKNYSMAVLAWSMGKNPDSLYSFYHSDMDVPGGYNMTGANDASLDAALSALRYAPDRESAVIASQEAQRLLAEITPCVPVYSRLSVAAVSNKWQNVIATDRTTADNYWSLISARASDGVTKTLKIVLAEEPRNLNPFTASSAYSMQVIGLIYDSLLSADPYTLSNIPSLAKSWDVDTKGEGASRHTELSFTLSEGLFWSDGTPLTARDVKATVDFLHKNKIPRFFDSVKNVKSTETRGENKIKIIMDGVSYWYLDNIAGLPILPEKVLADIPDWQLWDPLNAKSPNGPYGLTGNGPFTLKDYKPGEYVIMKKNPLFRMALRGE